jgi:hypothetical protein
MKNPERKTLKENPERKPWNTTLKKTLNETVEQNPEWKPWKKTLNENSGRNPWKRTPQENPEWKPEMINGWPQNPELDLWKGDLKASEVDSRKGDLKTLEVDLWKGDLRTSGMTSGRLTSKLREWLLEGWPQNLEYDLWKVDLKTSSMTFRRSNCRRLTSIMLTSDHRTQSRKQYRK